MQDGLKGCNLYKPPKFDENGDFSLDTHNKLYKNSVDFREEIDGLLSDLTDISKFDKDEPYNIFTLYKIYKGIPKDIQWLKSFSSDIVQNLRNALGPPKKYNDVI